jgi:hypothetical protein
MAIDNNNNPFLKFTETTKTVSISSGSITLDLNTASIFLVTRNANITTVTISNTNSVSSTSHSFSIVFTGNGSSYTVTWPASVKWAGNSAPSLTNTSAKKDILSFTTVDGGTNWYGFVGGLNF